jgi:putative salt-induced outer membrane protein YdiY
MTTKINFKFFIENEEKSNLIKTLSRIPEKHKELINNFELSYKNRTTLDKKNVGLKCGKKIQIASPWHYSKEFVTLHEVGHLVWENLGRDTKSDWEKLLKNTIKHQKKTSNSKSSLNQSSEEIFCMAYACAYSKHPSNSFYNKKWIEFIKNI